MFTLTSTTGSCTMYYMTSWVKACSMTILMSVQLLWVGDRKKNKISTLANPFKI